MSLSSKQIGQTGEDLAAKFLKKKGFKVLVKNFSTRFGEIDLIVVKKDLLVFVEVKTRVGDGELNPEWAINWEKIKRVEKMAQVFLAQNKINYQNLRIDAVCVSLNPEGKLLRLDHYENLSYEFHVHPRGGHGYFT